MKWDAVGLDIEPNFSEFGKLRTHKLRLAAMLLRRSFDMRRVLGAREAYAALMRKIQGEGYAVRTYQFLFLADERPAAMEPRGTGSDMAHEGSATVVPALNAEVLMIYTSFNHKADSVRVWSYGAEAQAIAVGGTARSGDSALDAKFPPLSWEELCGPSCRI